MCKVQPLSLVMICINIFLFLIYEIRNILDGSFSLIQLINYDSVNTTIMIQVTKHIPMNLKYVEKYHGDYQEITKM